LPTEAYARWAPPTIDGRCSKHGCELGPVSRLCVECHRDDLRRAGVRVEMLALAVKKAPGPEADIPIEEPEENPFAGLPDKMTGEVIPA